MPGPGTDACQILPPLTVEERAAFGVAATAEHAAEEPFTCRYGLRAFLRRPGAFHALINAGLDPFDLWKKLECHAPAAETRALLVRPAALVSKSGERIRRHWLPDGGGEGGFVGKAASSSDGGGKGGGEGGFVGMVPPVQAMPAVPSSDAEHGGWCCGRCPDREREGHRPLHGPLCEKIDYNAADVAAGTDPMEHTIAPVPGAMMFGLRRNRCPDEKADVVAVVVVVEI